MNQSTLAVMIQCAALSSSNCQTALDFCKAALNQNRKITLLFFYSDAVRLASNLDVSLQDEINISQQWQTFIQAENLPAVACISAALKRGILDNTEANRHKKTSSNLAKGFTLGGLAQWVDAVNHSDRHIIFG